MTDSTDSKVPPPKNRVASVQARLRRFAQENKTDFNRVLTRYANERFLFRLSQTDAGQKFVLKGAMLFTAWTGAPHRNTGDLDFLGFGDNAPDALEPVFRKILAAKVPEDGLVFSPDSLKIETRRDEEQYPGLKVKFTANLGKMVIPIEVDIGFGDAISPGVVHAEIPPILPHFPAVRLAMYPQQTVVAEKFEAIVSLDIANSRYKDFFDIWFLATYFSFDADSLCDAITATFERRKTPLPTQTPPTLTPEWAQTTEATQYWRGFVRRSGLGDTAPDFPVVASLVWSFLSPLILVLTTTDADRAKESTESRGRELPQYWPVGGPWQEGEIVLPLNDLS